MSGVRWTPDQLAAHLSKQGRAVELPKPPALHFRSKTEAMYADMLQAQGIDAKQAYECMTLVIGDAVRGKKTRFTPDFSFEKDGMNCVEVKGAYIRPDAMVKLKVAVRQYPSFRWYLAQRLKGGAWRVERLGA